MTEQEMRELDAWIAEHVFGWHRVPKVISDGGKFTPAYWWDPSNGSPTDPETDGMRYPIPLIYSTSVVCFQYVKHEIEQRGWRWVSSASFDDPPSYAFHIISKQRKGLALEEAATEELAGCLAFKAAMEATGEMS